MAKPICPQCTGEMTHKGQKQRADGRSKDYYRCTQCNFQTVNPVYDIDILAENVRLAKRTQRFQDSNRIERKAFREHARIENAVEAYSKAIIEALRECDLSKQSQLHDIQNVEAAGIVHLSDLHFNELVQLTFNKYDFRIASQRLHKLCTTARSAFKAFNIQNVFVAMTGDILNSDRRLDELLANATNRARASLLAVQILKQFILDLNQDFNVSVGSVTGNESRIQDEIGYDDLVVSDNYDYTIFEMLRMLFENSDGIRFCNLDPSGDIVTVGKKNVLLIHGESMTGDVEKKVLGLIGKWADRGIRIDLVLFGHLHCARVSDLFSRSASLVGANTYSDRGLHLIGRASQNIHIITGDDIHSMKIGVQDVNGYDGYNIDTALERYHPKSASKLKSKRVIFEVTI